jgi:hypothetical protein
MLNKRGSEMAKRQPKINTEGDKAVRCTFTLPANLYRDISSVSMAMGVSRSGLLVNVLGDSIHDMAVDLHDLYSSQPGPSVIRRLRGNSIARVEEAYREFMIETCPEDGSGEVVRS